MNSQSVRCGRGFTLVELASRDRHHWHLGGTSIARDSSGPRGAVRNAGTTSRTLVWQFTILSIPINSFRPEEMALIRESTTT